jgi:hypothetical protein
MGFSSFQGDAAFGNAGHLRDAPTDALNVSTLDNIDLPPKMQCAA